MNQQIQAIPFHGQIIQAALIDGKPHVALKPVCENIGIDFSSQLRRLKQQPWAVVVMTTTTGADGKTYEMSMIDRRTFTMWLATIDAGRLKNENARQLVEAYQNEAADALDRYFNEDPASVMVKALTNPKAVVQLLTAYDDAKQENQRLLARNSELEPKAKALDDFTNVEGTMSVATAANLISNAGAEKIGRDRLFQFMHELGWVYRRDGAWAAKQERIDDGYLCMKTHRNHGTHSDGSTFLYPPTVRVTRKGLALLYRRWGERTLRKTISQAEDQPTLEITA